MQTYAAVVAARSSNRCQCGATKQPNHYFCRACYFALPEAYRKRLWMRFRAQRAVCLIYSRSVAFLGRNVHQVANVAVLALLFVVTGTLVAIPEDLGPQTAVIQFEGVSAPPQAHRRVLGHPRRGKRVKNRRSGRKLPIGVIVDRSREVAQI
jgi:hypothetical protein